MKNNTHITCDHCAEQVLLPTNGDPAGANPLRGWVKIQNDSGEKDFCCLLCKHRYEHNVKHPKSPDKRPTQEIDPLDINSEV